MGVEEVFGELCNALGIGLGLKAETLALEEGLELFVVGDDTIVNDSELPLGIRAVLWSAKEATLNTLGLTGEDGSSGWMEDRE